MRRRERVVIATALLVLVVALVGGFLPPSFAGTIRKAGGEAQTAQSPAVVATPSPTAAVASSSPAPPPTPTVAATPMTTVSKTGTVVAATAPSRATPIPASQSAVAATPVATSAAVPELPQLFTPSLAAAAAPRISCEPPPSDDYATCQYTDPAGETMTFYLFIPRGFDPSSHYPLVLLLEGGGERAEDSKTADENRQTVLSDPYAAIWGPGIDLPDAPDVQAQFPSFIVLPQVDDPDSYSSVEANTGSYTLPDQPTDALRMAKEIVDTLRRILPQIDGNRLYVTGLSMGGYGTWELAERYPSYFAAAAPIAGAGDPSLASRLVDLPIWAFHSADDPIVPVSGSRDMIAAIEAAGGDPRYTEYTDLGHGSWLAPYGIMGQPSPTPDFYAWLFAQHK